MGRSDYENCLTAGCSGCRECTRVSKPEWVAGVLILKGQSRLGPQLSSYLSLLYKAVTESQKGGSLSTDTYYWKGAV